MPMRCSRCGYTREQDAEAWDCPHCGTTNRLAPPGTAQRRDSRATRTPTPRDADRRQPPGVTIVATPAEFLAVYRWFSWPQLLGALAALLVAALAMRFVRAPLGPVLAVVLGAAASYVALVALANHTVIHATREWLTVRHRPVPIIGRRVMDAFGFWPDAADAQVPTPKLLLVAKGGREILGYRSRDHHDTSTKIFLKAVYHDGVDPIEVQLLPSSAPPSIEDHVGWRLDDWLLAANLPFYKGAASVADDAPSWHK